MTIYEAARRAGITRQSIMELVDKGRIGWRDATGRHIDPGKFAAWLTCEDRLRYRGILKKEQQYGKPLE